MKRQNARQYMQINAIVRRCIFIAVKAEGVERGHIFIKIEICNFCMFFKSICIKNNLKTAIHMNALVICRPQHLLEDIKIIKIMCSAVDFIFL